MKKVFLRPEVRADLAAIRGWYERKRRGTGRKFLTRVSDAVSAIGRLPEGFPRVEGRDCRVCVVSDFPYVILYHVEPSKVVVFAVIHGRRDPETWPM